MGTFEIASVLITVAALFSYLNFRFLRLPTTIGVMLLSLACSVVLIAIGQRGGRFHDEVAGLVGRIDFNKALFHGMLAFLLFAGSLQLDLSDLARERDAIAILALFSTAVSTLLVAGLSWVAFDRLGFAVPPVWCLLFGALISPTDPIAVLGIMRKVGAPKALETQMAGESLFNDGIGVVIFLAVLGVAIGEHDPSPWHVALLLVREALGGAGVGLASGILVYRLLRRVDNYQVEVLLTLALCMGGYTVAEALHVSAPIAVVVAGLFIGNQGRSFAMSRQTEDHIDTFWELLDEVLNAVLFLLIGLQMLVIPLSWGFAWAGAASVAAVLLARWSSVGGAMAVMRLWRPFDAGAVTVLTWGGLRGGLSVAMALSLPASPYRTLIIAVTYAVVIFSVFAQGLTAGAVIRRVGRRALGASPPNVAPAART